MTPEELQAFAGAVAARHDAITARLQAIPNAPTDAETDDQDADALVEAIFLRTFSAYEADLERLFLHYVTGGQSLNNKASTSYLNLTDEEQARRLVRGANRFLTWSKPASTRATAETYLHEGWPIANILAAKAQDLSDCEKIRNRIAHQSSEAASDFGAVQRNLLLTERLFDLSPGQLLRMRFRGRRKLTVQHYAETVREVLEALLEPGD